jgi:hypothetical protein
MPLGPCKSLRVVTRPYLALRDQVSLRRPAVLCFLASRQKGELKSHAFSVPECESKFVVKRRSEVAYARRQGEWWASWCPVVIFVGSSTDHSESPSLRLTVRGVWSHLIKMAGPHLLQKPLVLPFGYHKRGRIRSRR